MAKKLNELGNMPPSLNTQEKRVFSQLLMSAQVQGARWCVFAFVELLLLLALVGAICFMTPLVKTIPYMVKVDNDSGQVLAKPGSITPHTKFKSEVYILSKEEGGRHTPFFNGYRPQFYFRTTDVTGVVTLAKGVEMVMPGDNVTFEVALITPIAMEKELRFAIREGGHTVGAGVVTEVIE